MANSLRGDIEFKAGASSYTMHFSTNALRQLEEMLDMSTTKIVKLANDPENFRLSTLQKIFWAGLQDHHPGLTMDDVTEIWKYQLPNETSEIITKALNATFEPEDSSARPPQQTATQGPNGKHSSPSGNL
jgi:hypothetical protein